MTTWTAPVRYAECDQQGIVFNSHYLTWCDEAMAAFCAQRGVPQVTEAVHLVTTTLTWRAPARWGETVEVDVRCPKVGRTSFDLEFAIRVGDRACCTVSTVYVNTDGAGTPAPIPDDVRTALS